MSKNKAEVKPSGFDSHTYNSMQQANDHHPNPGANIGSGGGSDTGMGMSQMTGQNAVDGILRSANLDNTIVQGEAGGNIFFKEGVWSRNLAEFSAGNLALVGGIENMNELAHGLQGEKLMLQHVTPGEQLNVAKGMSALGPDIANKGFGQGGH